MNKIVLITGATSGIGKETAKYFASNNYDLILACRNLEKAQMLIDEILINNKNIKAEAVYLDLSIFESVRECAKIINLDTVPDIIINNAGVFNDERIETVDGIEETMSVNYYGHFLLTLLILPKLIKSNKDIRVINVSSKAALYSEIDFTNINLTKRYHSFKAYGLSKLAMLYFTRELASKLINTRILVNSIHPGSVNTNIWGSKDNFMYKLIKKFSRKPEDSAREIYELSTSDKYNNITGKFIYKGENINYNYRSSDKGIQKKLWEHSLTAVDIQDDYWLNIIL